MCDSDTCGTKYNNMLSSVYTSVTPDSDSALETNESRNVSITDSIDNKEKCLILAKERIKMGVNM